MLGFEPTFRQHQNLSPIHETARSRHSSNIPRNYSVRVKLSSFEGSKKQVKTSQVTCFGAPRTKGTAVNEWVHLCCICIALWGTVTDRSEVCGNTALYVLGGFFSLFSQKHEWATVISWNLYGFASLHLIWFSWSLKTHSDTSKVAGSDHKTKISQQNKYKKKPQKLWH